MNAPLSLIAVIAGLCARARGAATATAPTLPDGPVFVFPDESRWVAWWRRHSLRATDIEKARRRLGYELSQPDSTTLPWYCPEADSVDADPPLPDIPEQQSAATPARSQPFRWTPMWTAWRILIRLSSAWVVLIGILSLILVVTNAGGARNAAGVGFGALVTLVPAGLLQVIAWIVKPPR